MDPTAGNAVDSDEEDGDFVPDRDDAGSPTGDTEEEGSEADEQPSAPQPAAATKKKREVRHEDDDDGRKEKKRKKKKKDPNAPKRALSSFMFFSTVEREAIRKTNPELAFTDVGRIIGDKWRKLSNEEKEPYENKARLDKARYREEMAEYRGGGQMAGDGGPSGEESG